MYHFPNQTLGDAYTPVAPPPSAPGDNVPEEMGRNLALGFIIGAAMAPDWNSNWWKWGLVGAPVVMALGNTGALAMAAASIGLRVHNTRWR